MSMTWTEEPWPRTSLTFSEILYKLHLTGHSSRTGCAHEIFKGTANQVRTPGPVKIPMNYPLVGLRLTSTDRTIYRHYLIGRKSHRVSTSFQLYCHLRSILLLSRVHALARICSEIVNQTPISATMLLNCVTDAACCNRVLEDYIESGCTCSLWFHSRQSRTYYRIAKRFEMRANREIHGWSKRSCFTGSVSISLFLCRILYYRVISNMTSGLFAY